MSCEATRDRLEEYRRGELSADAAGAVEAHLAGCPACRSVRERDDALAALVRGLPRTAAPDSLRRAVAAAAGRPARRSLARPWVAAALAAAAVLLVLLPWVEFRPERAPDPIEVLLRSGVEEHRRIVLEAEAQPDPPGDPARLFERVHAATGIQLPPVMAGVGELRLLVARPTMLGERKTAAAALRYPTSPVTTYFLLPGRDLSVPSEHRVQLEQYRPYMRRVHDFNVVYWKQGDLAYLMVSAMDEEHTQKLFLKMRKAL